MANGFGSLYIGASGLQNSQNALNTTSNNLANVNTKGYVRQQVLQVDRNYTTFNTTAAISQQQSGLGMKIGDVVHARDVFLDKSYRNASGRQAYYAATYEAVDEVYTFYQELQGQAFQNSVILAMCNRVGTEGNMCFSGESIVVDAKGDILAKADDTEQILYVDIDMQESLKIRNAKPYTQLRRPDFYL